MTTFILAMAGVALITGGAIAYGFKDKNARTFVYVLELFESVNGRVASEEIKKFKNLGEFQAFVDEEKEHAANTTYNPNSFYGLRRVYIAQGPEEILREMKKNCRSHADVQKYLGAQIPAFSIITLDIKPKN